jgi:Holliday junction resolvase
MAKTPEGEIKDQVRKVLDEMGAYYFFPAANGYGRTGIPDVIACVGGHFVGIECKAGSKQPTALQQRELDNIEKAEGTGLIVNADNISNLKNILENVYERCKLRNRL